MKIINWIKNKIKIYILKLNYYMEILCRHYPKVLSDIETLDILHNTNKSLVRFGDGEFEIIQNKNIGFQNKNVHLANRLEEILYSKKENVLIAIPRVTKINNLNKVTNNSREFWMQNFLENKKIYIKLESNYIYYDASVSRPYIRYMQSEISKKIFDMWKLIWENKNILIVEGASTCLGVGNNLFENANSIRRILCPEKNAYDKYKEIYEQVKLVESVDLVLVALGPTATVLANDLADQMIRTIDIGHIDLEYEWFQKNCSERVQIIGKFVNEIEGGDVVEDFNDSLYESQIIAYITL